MRPDLSPISKDAASGLEIYAVLEKQNCRDSSANLVKHALDLVLRDDRLV